MALSTSKPYQSGAELPLSAPQQDMDSRIAASFPRTNCEQSFYDPSLAPMTPSTATLEEQKESQKSIMGQKRELAIQRRKIEDETEEAAKRERIRKLMEAYEIRPLQRQV